jgi:cytochrome c-type biogenesis protein CcmE
MATQISEGDALTRRKRRAPWGFVLAGAAIAIAIAYLVFANTQSSAHYYLTVTELRACRQCGSQIVRVAGTVADGSVQRDAATQEIRFTVADTGGSLPVEYNGVVPDVFKAGVQVVVEGHLKDGLFHASTLLAKCPSKFQSATPGPQQ